MADHHGRVFAKWATISGICQRRAPSGPCASSPTHAWDLARAIGADDKLDADLVSQMWDNIQPMAAGLGELGMFGESSSGHVADDAPLQTRFLDLVGRRP